MPIVKIVKNLTGDSVPVYNYKCPKCEIIVQQEHKMDMNPKIRDCPDCKVSLFKMFTFGGVSFNGTGFYSNDKKEK
jgi:putative FmdB family regulatory protein